MGAWVPIGILPWALSCSHRRCGEGRAVTPSARTQGSCVLPTGTRRLKPAPAVQRIKAGHIQRRAASCTLALVYSTRMCRVLRSGRCPRTCVRRVCTWAAHAWQHEAHVMRAHDRPSKGMHRSGPSAQRCMYPLQTPLRARWAHVDVLWTVPLGCAAHRMPRPKCDAPRGYAHGGAKHVARARCTDCTRAHRGPHLASKGGQF